MNHSRILRVFCGMLCAGALGLSPVSAAILSPGLYLLSPEADMVKSGIVCSEISFTAADFTSALGVTPSAITVTALPTSGKLTLGDHAVLAGQVITEKQLAALRYIPGKTRETTSFRFRADGDYSHVCTLCFTDTANGAPTAADDSMGYAVGSVRPWTQQNVKYYGTLAGSDPDGDALRFELVSYPEKGLCTITNAATGDYIYTPYDGALSEDTFTYRVRDSYGQYSESARVSVTIAEPVTTEVFADMDGHWAQNAVMVLSAEGILRGVKIGGETYYHPDDVTTREDFLVTVMKALGAGEIEPCVTDFADNVEISADASGYVQRALSLGIIHGSETNGKLCFRPNDPVTRAEAAVICNAILGAETPEMVPTFADSQAIPAWASPSLYALSNLGILRGTGDGNLSPDAPISRAQTAQMLYKIRQYLAS